MKAPLLLTLIISLTGCGGLSFNPLPTISNVNPKGPDGTQDWLLDSRTDPFKCQMDPNKPECH